LDNKVISTGFFTIEDTRHIENASIQEAKSYALERIQAQPNARPNNVAKATEMVNRATSIKALMLGMANFILAHPSENLKNV
jgi:hypothetical protein